MATSPMLIRSFVTISIGLVISIIAVALPYWWTNRAFSIGVGVGYDSGLFKLCADITTSTSLFTSDTATETVCAPIESPPAWLRGVQALTIIGILLISGCLPVLILYCTLLKEKHALLTLCSIGLFASGLFWGIGTVVFLAMQLVNLKVGVGMPHASFYLACLAEGMMTSSGRMVLKARPNENSNNNNTGNTQAPGNNVVISTAGNPNGVIMTSPQVAAAGVFVPMNQGPASPGYYGMPDAQPSNVHLQMTPGVTYYPDRSDRPKEGGYGRP